MDKPTKPSNLMPRSFGGVKNNWSESMQTSGYEDGIPAIYGGDNLNYQLDTTGKELDYCEKICDFINDLPVGKVITTDTNNKLIYGNLPQAPDIATPTTVGVVKPDNDTIIVDENGTISATGANVDLSNLSVYGEAKISNYMRYLINDGNIDANGKLDLIDAEESTDTTYSYAQPGTYTFTVPTTTTYPIALIAPGGTGSQSFNQQLAAWYVAGGGSGGGFVGTINLTAGTYTVEVGSGQSRNSTVLKDSNNNVLITATAGNNGTSSATSSAGGVGGSLTVASGVTVSANTVGSNYNHDDGNGYKGQQGLIYGYMGQALGGASIYNGYGKGGNNVQKGWDGYFEIVIQNQGSSEVNYKVSSSSPLTIVDAQGVKSVLYGVNNDQIGSLADGTYNKFVDATGTDFLANNITYQLKEPTSPSTNDIWVKTAEKIEVYKYDGADWQPYNRVLIGTVVVSNGAVATGGIKNTKLYENGFNVTTYQRTHYIIEAKSENGLWYRLYNDGWLEQGGNKANPLGSAASTFDIDFYKSFGNTNYQFFRAPVWIATNATGVTALSNGCNIKDNAKVTISCHGSNVVSSVDWYACGYVS